MNPTVSSLAMFLVGIYLVSVTAAAAATTKGRPLCADSSGIFLGLSTDEDAYESHMGFLDSTDDEDMCQSWTLTQEEHTNPHDADADATPTGPQHSYDGRFLQVLEDSGRSYPPHGQHLLHARDLDKNAVSAFQAPYVTFLLTVTKEGRGIHTLFLRWTGGDTVGGGDSLYVVMYKKGKKGTKTLVTGQQTVKPAVVPIETGIGRYAGCCYDMVTHACPCFSVQPSNATCANFITTDRASAFGAQCRIGGGAMTIVKHPEWYLYAGQEAGDVMDFDSEPWDVTCEADGSNTRDSGHDFPSWVLEPGVHELRIYAREDGTALDGIYVAGPTGRAPTVSKRYSRGDSTFCPKPPFVSGKSVGLVFGGLAILGVIWFSRTSAGKEIFSAVLSKPSQATRYIYVEGT